MCQLGINWDHTRCSQRVGRIKKGCSCFIFLKSLISICHRNRCAEVSIRATSVKANYFFLSALDNCSDVQKSKRNWQIRKHSASSSANTWLTLFFSPHVHIKLSRMAVGYSVHYITAVEPSCKSLTDTLTTNPSNLISFPVTETLLSAARLSKGFYVISGPRNMPDTQQNSINPRHFQPVLNILLYLKDTG